MTSPLVSTGPWAVSLRAQKRILQALYHASERGGRTARNLPTAVPPRLNHHSTPDIILFPHTDMSRLKATAQVSQLSTEEKTIVCIELTHTADTHLAPALHDKMKQHALWFDLVRQAGWTVHCVPVVVTHSGWVTDTAATAPKACGVDSTRAVAVIRSLARNALRYNQRFVHTRRHLYRALPPPDPQPQMHQPP